jgi:Na+-translocating ferredoxin:NAD+ oxidoreductase subunit B
MISEILLGGLSIGGIGIVLGTVLAYAAKTFHVPVDPKVEAINDVLPQGNCGGCGYAGCGSYAEAICKDNVAINLCAPGGQAVIDGIANIMGVEASCAEPMVAYIGCQGSPDKAVDRFDYLGPTTCSNAIFVSGGLKACNYGCLGYGDCVNACMFGALYLDESTRLPVVDRDLCVGCEACTKACPKNVVSMMPKSKNVYVACNSRDKGKIVSEFCEAGCIACKICSLPKTTPSGAVKVKGNLPVIDYSIEDDLLITAEKCPKKCFLVLG